MGHVKTVVQELYSVNLHTWTEPYIYAIILTYPGIYASTISQTESEILRDTLLGAMQQTVISAASQASRHLGSSQ